MAWAEFEGEFFENLTGQLFFENLTGRLTGQFESPTCPFKRI
jgi:hypothetical protein